ncbi:ABC transporter permease [Pseudomonas sp. PB120]|uniref:ABC transporter permease n=1 Tax=Pseudomonas sp. PB120 TaxID=2494700 RepID=UPI0012FE7A8F|nr:ABC transporter permease [Pseudomonas sp. PB120]MVV50790.1 ABC transporter permease [Pseudomonas sp. PB120]
MIPPGPWAIRWRHAKTFVRWVLSSIGIILPVFLFSTLITFALGAASGLNPAAGIAGDSATPEMIAQINTELGLDRPLLQQYLSWMQGIFTGDLGNSWFNQVHVSELIQQRLAVSLSVAGLALVIGIVFGVLLGILAAVYEGRWIDRAITGVTTVISTLPAFVVAIGLILIFSLWLRWLPSAGYVSPSENFSVWLKLITMPAIALSVDVAAELARQLRTGLVSTLSENYVTGAIVRGLSWPRILFVHVLRNGAAPALSILGMKIPTLLGGAVVTETIFTMPGLGMLSADSALRGDVPVVQGTLVVSIAFVLAANILINIMQGTLQPASRRRS